MNISPMIETPSSIAHHLLRQMSRYGCTNVTDQDAEVLARAVLDMQREIAGHAALEEIAKEGAERFRDQLAAARSDALTWAASSDAYAEKLSVAEARLKLATDALEDAMGTIEGLAGQQAMDDPWYEGNLAKYRAALAGIREGV